MKKPYVAIVDDDSGFSNYLRTFLSLRGYDTRSYSRGDELLAAIRQADPPGRRAAGRDDARPRRPRDAAGAEGRPAGNAGHHALRPRAGVHDRRGGPPRGSRLRGQAGRSRRPGRDRARRRDQERAREEPPGVGADGTAAATE